MPVKGYTLVGIGEQHLDDSITFLPLLSKAESHPSDTPKTIIYLTFVASRYTRAFQITC
jgi:hypothetical protein